MKNQLMKNGSVYINRKFEPVSLYITEGKIQIWRTEDIPENTEVIDAAGKKIVPGFIDIHTHGAVGFDVNGADADALKTIGKFFAGNGTTSWLASVLTDTREQTEWCIDQYRAFDQSGAESAELLGIHLEGPFLAKAYKGAMPEHLLIRPELELIREYQQRAGGNIRYITVAPEVEGIVELIPKLKKLGIVVAIPEPTTIPQWRP